MVEKLSLRLALVLPGIPDERDSCIARLTELLQGSGLEKVHIVQQDNEPHLCFHYDPQRFGMAQVRSMAQASGAQIGSRYQHELMRIDGKDCATCATVIEHALCPAAAGYRQRFRIGARAADAPGAWKRMTPGPERPGGQCDVVNPFYRAIMKKLSVLIFTAMSMAFASTAAIAAPEKSRQEAVSERGPDVMPFDLKATTHIFTKTKTGGVQKVVAKDARNDAQIRLIRAHLQEIAAQFAKGDYSGPTHLHGADMPGLSELKNARATEIKVQYTAVTGGGMIVYTTKNPKLLAALHRWFDAQLSDHGSDAMPGHDHSMMHHQ